MMKPCHFCDVVDFEDLLQTCSIYHEVHEHLYCMEVNLSKKPRIWHCKECQLQIDKVQEQSKEHMAIVDTLHSVNVQYTGTDEEPCQVCGDVGYGDLLQTCSICREIHEHLYCMEVKLSEIPTFWHCKACQLQIDKVQQQFKEPMVLVDPSHVHSKGTNEHLSEMPAHKTIIPPKCKLGSHKFKGPKTGKVKFLPTEAVLGMGARGRPKASSMHSSPSPRPNTVDVSYNPLSRRNPAACTIASPRSHQKGLAQESPRHSKLPSFDNLQAGTHKIDSQSKSFPGQTPSLAFEGSGTRKIAEDVRRLLDASNKEISAGSEDFLKIKKEEDKPDHRGTIDVNNYKDSIGATLRLGKRKNRPEDQMRVCDATNKVNSTWASQRLEKGQMEEERPVCVGVSSVLSKEKSIGALMDLRIRRMEEGGSDCMRIMDVADKEKSTGDSKSLGKGKIKEDEPEDSMKIMDATSKEKPTSALESSGKRKTQEDPEDCLKNAHPRPLLASSSLIGKIAISIPSRFLEKNGLADGILSHTHETSESKTVSQFQEEFLNPPATKATWEGSFAVADIFDRNGVKDIYDGFRAHPSRKVSRKAYDVAKKLPKMVKLKLYRRCDMWPHIFNKDGPSEFDIALYFLPGDIGRSIDYLGLLELIEKQDLMMQSCMDGVDLLIFTSKQLPLNSQTYNAQLYLWGIFRSRKGSSVTSKSNECEILVPFAKSKTDQDPTDISSAQEHDAVEDMEIDMIGGMDVGRVDVPLRKKTYEMEMELKKKTTKFNFSNSLILRRKLTVSHGREIGRDNSRTTDCNNHAVASSPRLSFKLHGHKMIDRSGIQDRSKDFERLGTSHQLTVVEKEHIDYFPRHSQVTKNAAPMENREELLLKSSSSSSPEFPPGFTKPIK